MKIEEWIFPGPGMDMYIVGRRYARMFEHEFVSYIWGIEVLHRQMVKTSNNPALVKKIARVLSDIKSKKDSAWARRTFERTLEPPLSERIHDILKDVVLLKNRAGLRQFSVKCAERRNDLSHFGGLRYVGGRPQFRKDVFALTRALRILYHVKILQEVGVPLDSLERRLTQGFGSRNIADSLKAVGFI